MAEVMMHRSSYIDETSYDQDSEELAVTFADGATWKYIGVPRGIYTSFITSASKGRYFRAFIRDNYESEEV